jgi:hypothetical protein
VVEVDLIDKIFNLAEDNFDSCDLIRWIKGVLFIYVKFKPCLASLSVIKQDFY